MPAKPITSQVCNTQACGPECNGPNQSYNIKPYSSCGWSIWYTWAGTEIGYVQYNQYPWYANIGGYLYYTSTSSACQNNDDYPGGIGGGPWNICRQPA